MKTKISQLDYIKANRKASREEEIQLYGKPVSFSKVFASKKKYTRKKKHKNKEL